MNKDILNINEVRQLLYNEYRNEGRILEVKELQEKKIITKHMIKKIYKTINKDVIWQDVAKYYNCHIPTELEQKKEDLIKEIKEVAKSEGEPVNSKLHRGLYHRACNLFGSWRELNMCAGIQISKVKSTTIDINRRDEILEKIMILFIVHKKIYKSKIYKYKNMASYKTIEKITHYKWEEIIKILHVKLQDVNKYRYMDNKEILQNILKDKNVKSLYEYSFKDTNDKIPFIYVVNKININWEWFKVLRKNKFIDCNNVKFKYTKKQLMNILAFKYSICGRALTSTEINNDSYLPGVINIMKMFNKNIYDIWRDIEKDNKYEL